MELDTIDYHFHVDLRDNIGRFIEHCEEAARRSADEAAAEGARVARLAAPRKSGRMAGTIRAKTTYTTEQANSLGTMAEFTVGTGHWKYQEFGTRPHPITGMVSFFWDLEGRPWVPGRNMIRHPGNRGVHFMHTGYDAAARELRAAVHRNY